MQEFEVDVSLMVHLLQHSRQRLSSSLVCFDIDEGLAPPVQPCLADGPLSADFARAEHLQEERIDGVVVWLYLDRHVRCDSERIVVKLPKAKPLH